IIMDYSKYHDAAHLAQTSKNCLFAYCQWSDMPQRRKIEDKKGYNNEMTDEAMMTHGLNLRILQQLQPPNVDNKRYFYYQYKEVSRAVVPPSLLHAFPPSVDDSFIIRLDRNGKIDIFTKYDLDTPQDHLSLFIDQNEFFYIGLSEKTKN